MQIVTFLVNTVLMLLNTLDHMVILGISWLDWLISFAVIGLIIKFILRVQRKDKE